MVEVRKECVDREVYKQDIILLFEQFMFFILGKKYQITKIERGVVGVKSNTIKHIDSDNYFSVLHKKLEKKRWLRYYRFLKINTKQKEVFYYFYATKIPSSIYKRLLKRKRAVIITEKDIPKDRFQIIEKIISKIDCLNAKKILYWILKKCKM